LLLLTVGVETVDAMLDLGENATGGIQLANSNNRRYHLSNVDGCEAVGLCLEKYRRLRVSAVYSSVGWWDAGPGLDLIAVRVKFGDSEIEPCPEQMEAPSFRKTRASVGSKAVLWLDGEYAVRKGTRRCLLGAVG
jgi:hypothetical protein